MLFSEWKNELFSKICQKNLPVDKALRDQKYHIPRHSKILLFLIKSAFEINSPLSHLHPCVFIHTHTEICIYEYITIYSQNLKQLLNHVMRCKYSSHRLTWNVRCAPTWFGAGSEPIRWQARDIDPNPIYLQVTAAKPCFLGSWDVA